MRFLPHMNAIIALGAIAGLRSNAPEGEIDAPMNFAPILPDFGPSEYDKPKLRLSQSRYTPHQSAREIARRKRQLAAGQIAFIRHSAAA